MSRPAALSLCGALLACSGGPSTRPEAPAPAARRPDPAAAPRAPGVRAAWVHRMMRPDQVPPLHRPRHLSVRRARGLLRPTDRVLGVWIDGDARAYPLNLLAYHRVVNDELGGRSIAVAHSPLSGSSLCARTHGRLRHSGKVYEGDDLLSEAGARGSEERLWSVLLGRRLVGAERLERLPCVEVTWAAWRRLRPQTTVVWPSSAPRGFDYRRDPWAWYRRDDRYLAAPLHRVDLRLPYKQPVLGFARGGRAWIVPLSSRRVVNTTLDGEDMVLVMDERAGLGAAYRRSLEGRALTFEARSRRGMLELVDRQTASRWNLLGEAVAGPLAGRRLEPAGTRAFFFAWAALHPERPGQITFRSFARPRRAATRRDSHG